MIGIDTNTWLVFEGVSHYGRCLRPTPTITLAKIIENDEDWDDLPQSTRIEEAKLIFREDSFDPVTRVRRGRLYEYQMGQVQPADWFNGPHPADSIQYVANAARVKQSLATFYPLHQFGSRLRKNPRMLLMLGHADAPTVWRIISAERTPSGEDLITLRARSSFGALPDILEDHIPEAARPPVLEALDRVTDGAFRSSAVSLIDLCRDAAVVCIGRWLVSTDVDSKFLGADLGRLITEVSEAKQILRDAAAIINRLHPRGKSNERERLGVRIPTDEDAETALNCLGLILREIGWAR